MAYEKLNLQDGDVLKAEHLSHMEEGIERASSANGIAEALGYTPADEVTVGQLSAEIDDLSAIEFRKDVKITATEVVTGCYIDSSGVEAATGTWVCTTFLPLEFVPGTEITARCTLYAGGSLAFYDASKTFIEAINGNNAGDYGLVAGAAMQTISVACPAGAAYVRLSAFIDVSGGYEQPTDFVLFGTGSTPTKDVVERLSAEMGELKHESIITDTGTILEIEPGEGAEITVTGNTTETVTLVHQGKNFIPLPSAGKTELGVTWTVNDDGTVSASGTSTGMSALHFQNKYLHGEKRLPPGTYTLSTNSPNGGTVFSLYGSESNPVGNETLLAFVAGYRQTATFTINSPMYFSCYFQVVKADVVTDFTCYVQLEKGDAATEFEKSHRVAVTTTLPTVLIATEGKNVLYTEAGDIITASAKKTQLATTETLINERNPLYNKILSATGDSITATTSIRDYASYAKMIAYRNEMIYDGQAIWGATLASGIENSSGCILDTLSNMRGDADYVILSGGANDFYYLTDGTEQMGEMTSTWGTTFDTTTFLGALEQLCCSAIEKWPGKKILYVITHRMSGISETYVSKMIEVLRKWGIPYVDLWHDMPSLYLDALKNTYTSMGNAEYNGTGDGLHPNEAGYKAYYVPPVESKMKSI